MIRSQEQNRRRGRRDLVASKDGFAFVLTGRHRLPVLIINESVGGLGAVVVNPPRFDPGAVVYFESLTRRRECKVTSVGLHKFSDAVVCRIGLEWTD